MGKTVCTILICFLGLLSCIEEKAKYNNILYAHLNIPVQSIHITNDQTSPKTYLYTLLQKPLYQIDLRTQKLVPVLVSEVPATSNRIHTFTLRKDVRWDDGSLLTSADIDFTYKVVLNNLTNNGNIRPALQALIDSIITYKNDSLRFDVVFKNANIFNAKSLTEVYIMQEKAWDPEGLIRQTSYKDIVSKNYDPSDKIRAWFKDLNDPKNGSIPSKVNGLGPYKLTAWEQDEQIICERKSNWWGANDTLIYNQAGPEKIIFLMIPDPDNATTAFKSEKLDFSHRMNTVSMNKLKASENFKNNYDYEETGEFNFTFMGLNCKPDGIEHKKLFTDKNVRRAMAYLTPADDIIRDINYGNGTRMASMILPLKPYYNHDLKDIPLDHKRAEVLLDEAGWTDSDGDFIRDKIIDGKKVKFSFRLSYPMQGPYGDMAKIIANEMKQSGIELISDPQEFQTLIGNLMSHNYDATLVSLIGDSNFNDPTQVFATKSWAEHGLNFTGFGDAYSDSLIQVISQCKTVNEYFKNIKLFQKKVYDEQPCIFLYQSNKYVILHKRFEHDGFFDEKPGAILQAFRLRGGQYKDTDG